MNNSVGITVNMSNNISLLFVDDQSKKENLKSHLKSILPSSKPNQHNFKEKSNSHPNKINYHMFDLDNYLNDKPNYCLGRTLRSKSTLSILHIKIDYKSIRVRKPNVKYLKLVPSPLGSNYGRSLIRSTTHLKSLNILSN